MKPIEPQTTPDLIVGDYNFRREKNGKIWMQHSEGEGMEIDHETEKRLNDYLGDFFQENF